MEIVGLIILVIAALVGGYYFLKKYKNMDAALFGDVEGYNPAGIYIVYISAVIGALFGCIFMYTEMTNNDVNTDVMSVVICTIMSLILCTSIYQSILAFDNISTVIGKSLWLFFSCALAAVIGFAGSVIIICLIILYLVIAIFGKMIFSSGSSPSSDSSEKKTYGEIEAETLHLQDRGYDEYYSPSTQKHYRKTPNGDYEEM